MTTRFPFIGLALACALTLGCPDPPTPPEVDLDNDGWPDVTDPCVDVDGDGYGRPQNDTTGCVLIEPDCDDTDATIHPEAPEVCDARDNDCDEDVDEGLDGDGDGYTTCGVDGVPGNTDDDCNDSDADVYPGADELCDGLDNDCDDELPADEEDGDGDGFLVCEEDCDDGDETFFPGAPELCDGLDNDCDGITDANEEDGDGDAVSSCGGDCDDGAPDTCPGAPDTECDGIDQDCDGVDAVPASATFDLGHADGMLVGASTDDYAGRSVDIVGDVDGDGNVDVLIGAHFTDVPQHARAGQAHLIYGPLPWYMDMGAADATFSGEGENHYAGYDVSGAGDTDGDGKADLLVGAYGHDQMGTLGGKAYLFLGPPAATMVPDATFLAEAGADYAGRALDGAGDVDGDGLADVLIGADGNAGGGTNAGAAYLFFGEVTGDHSLAAADVKLVGESNGDRAGIDVAGAGDVNDDGFADILVGAYGADYLGDGRGKAYLIYGSVGWPAELDLVGSHATMIGEFGSDQAGYRVAGAGDVNGDGYDDLLVGAPGNDEGGSQAGKVYLVHGPPSGPVMLAAADASFVGQAEQDAAGYGIDGVGDADGDGFDDILIGAKEHDANSDPCEPLGVVHRLWNA